MMTAPNRAYAPLVPDVRGLRIPERTLLLLRDLIAAHAGIHYDDARLEILRDRIVPLAIERGRQLEARAFGDVRTKYAVADATQLDRDLDRDRSESRGLSSSSSAAAAAAPRTFDVVVDKSTVDAVSCGGVEPFLRMASAVRRCLARGGFWISLSYSSRRFDVDGLVRLLHAEATLSMPPLTLWLKGPDAIRAWLLGPGNGCKGSRLVPVEACGAPAFAQYRQQGAEPWAILVLDVADDGVLGWCAFLDVASIFPRLGVPLQLPGGSPADPAKIER